MLRGKTLQAGNSFPVRVEDGVLQFEVIHPLTPVLVDERTEFGIVAVRERLSVRGVYQCATCRREGKRTYGPFICLKCPELGRRVCDLHAIVLPGSLIARCPQHQPECRGGDTAAAIWCPGPRCESRTAWCRRHSASHSSEPTASYCLPCMAELFPPCRVGNCDAVGSISCDHLSPDGRPCDERRCPRHAKRWQVFGPHAEGLGRCEVHAQLRGRPAEVLLYQVLGACAVRGQPPPSLASLRHMLMKLTEQNRGMREVFSLAVAAPASAPPALQRQVSDLVTQRKQRWRKAVEEAEDAVKERTAQLQNWLNQHNNFQAASSLEGTYWSKPREGKPGMLRVSCDARLLSRAWRDAASAELGFEVRLETRS
jgi:hypothetical protein